MKKIRTLLTIGFIFIAGMITAQTPHYYYYQGEKQYLNLDKSRVFVSVVDTNQLNLTLDINNIEIKKSSFKRDISIDRQVKQDYAKRYWKELNLKDNLSAGQYRDELALMRQNNTNALIAPYFTNQSGDKIGLSNFLYVKLKSLNDTIILSREVEKENAIIVLQNQFMPLWFVVSITEKSQYNAMELANVFHESELFQSAEPDLMVENLLSCTNDTYFGDQWGLNNTGQNGGTFGVDIKACSAWHISTGYNIVVAVLDHGIELNHPDLAANIYPQSYDTENGTSPSVVRGSHGTACAGIVGAVRNNNAGITGVAPNCKLMSISNDLSAPTTLIKQQLADGINWAWQHGADVISNSWSHNSLAGNLITDAINAAVAQGRNGKGCVVVFSSGNSYTSSVNYPGSLPDVIAVGAISNNGQRANFSNYGTALDMVAPGVLIPTTDRQGNSGYNYVTTDTTDPAYSDYSNKDYTGKFGGTSAACPHVAGVAALVLSAKSSLTGQQVRDIIESTAQKVGGYNYQTTSGHHSGTWNNEMGYGLVDAYAAVQAVFCVNNFTNRTITTNTTVNGCNNLDVENVNVKNNATLKLNAPGTISIAGPFSVREGSSLEVR